MAKFIFKKWLLVVGMTASAFGLTYAAQPTQVEQAQAASTRYAQVDHLNIRTGPSTKYRVVGQFNKNDKVSVLKSYNTKWYQISYKGAKRYVSKMYVAKLPVYIGEGLVTTPKGINLNIRSGPNTKSNIVGKVMSGKDVYIIDFVDNSTWYKIYYKGVIGYATSQYVYFYH